MLFWTAGSGNRSATPCRLRFVGELLADLGQVILAVGILDMGQQLRPFAHQMHPAPEQVAGGAHLGGIDIGLWEHAAAQQHGNFLGVDLVVFGLAAMDRFHVERVAQDEGNTFLGAEVGEPVPGEDAFDADDEIRPDRARWP